MILVAAILLAQSVEAPSFAELPDSAEPDATYRLVREEDGKELRVQRIGRRGLAWIDALPPSGGDRRYRLEGTKAASASSWAAVAVEGRHVLLRYGGKDVLRYNTGRVPAPPGVDERHAFSGYIHPLWTPSGSLLSSDFPPKHEHHHGLWFCWRKTEVEGRAVNAWAPLEGQGTVEVLGVEETWAGPVFAGVRVRHRLMDAERRPILEDRWDVRAFAAGPDFVIDLDSAQTAVGTSPVTILKHPYGGMAFRGAREWEGKGGVEVLTSEGRTRADGNGIPARWVLMNGKIGGRDAGIAFLCHPANVRAPQPTRLAPESPLFCWVPSFASDLSIEPGKPFVSRYRFIVADRALTSAEIDRQWEHYGAPSPKVAPGSR